MSGVWGVTVVWDALDPDFVWVDDERVPVGILDAVLKAMSLGGTR